MVKAPQDILMTSGATWTAVLELDDDDALATGDTLYFTIKEDDEDTDAMIEKTVTTFTDEQADISLTPDETELLTEDAYVYDVWIYRGTNKYRVLYGRVKVNNDSVHEV